MSFKSFHENFLNKSTEKEQSLIEKGYLPLTPEVLKSFEIETTAYHVTSVENIKNIENLQNKSNDISTFTRGSIGLAHGARVKSEILFELEGYSSFYTNTDIWTSLDENGHRWLKPFNPKYGLYIKNNFTDKIKTTDKIEFYNKAKKIINKKFIQGLNQEIEKWISKNKNKDYDNNEILLHNFKIKNISIIADTIEEFQEIKEKLLVHIKLTGKLNQITRKEIANMGK